MSHIVRGILGAIAVTGTLGVAQLAIGGDLGEPRLQQQAASTQNVNRDGKADRGAVSQLPEPGQTFGVTLVGQSVLVRVPDAQVGEATRTRAQQPSAAPRRMVACEPVVSVLTEVAKQLQPGRCMT
ncbi:hypothetical protein [Rhodopseudomonas telluris]|uniref:Uncharacterized protein n=1 Tax=Rhodopseudomonas telluris TaxID=644215 RepID=A0ABV6END7_9BRAD